MRFTVSFIGGSVSVVVYSVGIGATVVVVTAPDAPLLPLAPDAPVAPVDPAAVAERSRELGEAEEKS